MMMRLLVHLTSDQMSSFVQGSCKCQKAWGRHNKIIGEKFFEIC